MIHELLDEQENKTIIFIDGKKYEQIEFEFEHSSTVRGNQISTYILGTDYYAVINAEHNGYISEAGDTLTTTWKIIRTLQ